MTEPEILAKIEWLKQRKGIGASMAASCLGLSPYQTRREAFYEIRACIDGDDKYLRQLVLDQANSRHIMRGNALEPIALAMYAKEKGVIVGPSTSQFEPSRPWLWATPDGEVTSERIILDAKAPASFTVKSLMQKGLTEPWLVQGWVQLACFPNALGMEFAMLNADAWELHTPTVSRDIDAIDGVLAGLDQFWHDHIEANVVPDDDHTVIDLPKYEGSVQTVDDTTFLDLASLMLEAQDTRKEWEQIEKGAKEQIQGLMENSGYSVVEATDLIRVYWVEQKGRTIIDTPKIKKLFASLGMEMSDYQKQIKASRPFRAYDLRGKSDGS